jgi:hypothetical protein
MKNLILALLMATMPFAYAVETKKVCMKELDAKTKKEKEVCKTIKVHKKLEGTKIEDAKKK